MPDISWLHLSDLHTHAGSGDHHWPAVRKALFEDLPVVHDLCGGWDLVLFTGDMVFSGQEDQYDTLNARLDELWELFEQLGSSPAMYAVPGNHDLVWPDRASAVVRTLIQPDQYMRAREALFTNDEPDYRRAIDGAFANYAAWAAACPHLDKSVQAGLLPGDFVATASKDGICLGLAGRNTTFLQLTKAAVVEGLTGETQEGHLDLHPRQIQAACDGDPEQWATQHHACLLMTHHPPTWLGAAGKGALDADIAPPGRFAAHLCGHVHETLIQELSEGGSVPRRLWQSGSLYGMQTTATGELARSHGYSVGKISVTDGSADIRFWPREAELVGGSWAFGPGRAGGRLERDDHTAPAPVGLLAPFGTAETAEGEEHSRPRPVAVRPTPPTSTEVAQGPDEDTAATPGDLPTFPDFTLPAGAQLRISEITRRFVERALSASTDDDIVIAPVRLPNRYTPPLHRVVPLGRKVPASAPIVTARQIIDSFIPFPKIVWRLDEWLQADRDLLFLAPPLCGKTSLLTFLAYEAARRGGLYPIQVHAPRELRDHEIPAAVARCVAKLQEEISAAAGACPVLIIDNVHEATASAIASELMGHEDRPWRIWAAARAREFADGDAGGRAAGAWEPARRVTDACSLATTGDWQYIDAEIIEPLLRAHGAGEEIDAVRDAIRAKGDGPMWTLIETWRTIYADARPVEGGYAQLVRRVPDQSALVVDALRPRNIAGHDVLAVIGIIPGPSELLLLHVLTCCGEYPKEVYADAVSSLRGQLTLYPDPGSPDRLVTPDVASDIMADAGNQTPRLAAGVSDAVGDFLDTVPPGSEVGDSGDLAAMWSNIGRACERGEEGLRARCASRSVEHARRAEDDGALAAALHNLAVALERLPDADQTAVLAAYDEALGLVDGPERAADRATILFRRAVYVLDGSLADNAAVVAGLEEALGITPTGGDALPRVLILGALAAALHGTDADAAADHWREAMDTAASVEGDARISVLEALAYRIEAADQTVWAFLIECRRSIVDLLEHADAVDRTRALSDLVLDLILGGEAHAVDETLSKLHATFALLPADADPYVRASGLAGIAAGLSAQEPSDWPAVATAARDLLPLATAHDYAGLSRFARRALFRALGRQKVYTPESRAEEAVVHQARAAENGSANSSFGVVKRLDAAGQYADADRAAAALEGTDLAEKISDPSRVSVIRARRTAYLALRANDAGEALRLTDEHAEGPGSVRVRLLRCVAWYAQGDIGRARHEAKQVDASWDDITWLRVIAYGYFRRYAPHNVEPFFAMLSAAYGTEVSVTLD